MPSAADLSQKLGALLVRVASIGGGVLIIKHEVYEAESAELILIALGLWLIGVPPALWLDALRRSQNLLNPEPKDDGK
jgi:hypothetical protein